ncbi:protein phosphatase 1 regulatory subunit 15B-like [Myxocyprinus asiaticus]|uniref:protein phosphatase 1 regulatory subunit 15B-like n=1 Tax=Myxocyprinus asiaticus TaxID=70543 RepID=UPI0022234B1E|nr:protein phosphatase 1 regulatory subunit 15B-like [Myxocyprinus asiaticus]
MFRSMSARGHFSKGDTCSTRDSSDDSTDSSWISVFSLVSRPAWSLLQRYLPGRAQTAFDVKSNLDIGNSLMGGLGETPLKVKYLHCQHENAACASTGDPGTLAWLTQDSLSELGIRNTAQKDFNVQRQASVGYLGTARNFLSQVLSAPSSKEKVRTAAKRGRPESGCVWGGDTAATRSANTWWLGGFWGGEDSPQNWLLNVPQSRKETDTSWQHCGVHHSVGYCQSRAQAAVSKTTEMCVRSDGGGSMHNESAGPLCSKERVHNESLHAPKPESLPSSYQLPLDIEQHNVFKPLDCSRAYSEVAVLTPDQDNGYSSLEEEHSLSKLCSMKLLSDEQELLETGGPVASDEISSQSNITGNDSVEQAHSEPATYETETNQREDAEFSDSEKTADLPAAEDLPTSRCQNKVIAYIMGSPCSEVSESEDEGDWDSNDDDGFDSEGSSHFSESEDLDDSDDETEDDSDGDEADSETERLWNSLCQNGDPYNPRNFTAPIRTASKPSPAMYSSVSESPSAHMSSHFSPPLSSLSLSENESSEEACEMDEEENHRLWNSFTCSADPYSLLNFQAPIQTQKPPKGCHKETAQGTPCYKGEEAEERLDSGFSEISPLPCSSSAMGVQLKKVKFVEEVEEFYASSDEDRHGPWEEIARDRCRFQRRVQEVEETISYCLSPTFRLVIYQRLYNTS